MNLRLVQCSACKTSYMIEAESADRPPPCPKCGAAARPASAAPVKGDAGPTIFVPSTPAKRRRGWKWAALALTALVVVAVAAVVAWPMLRNRWHSEPSDPAVAAASAYLRAIASGDVAARDRIGIVELPPAIRSFRYLRRDPAGTMIHRGSFAPVAALHTTIESNYSYDIELGRYTPKNALLPAAELLDTLHDAKTKSDMDAITKKIQSGNPDDLFDAAEGLGKSFTALAEGALAPKKLIPTYAQLLDGAKPPLAGDARALARDYSENRKAWDALLGRPFATLKADGPFVFERAEVTASGTDTLASSGDPPVPLRLTLTRFRLEGIDTGWRVTAVRREGANTPTSQPAPERSPGEPPTK